jgi:glyoxylase-like metal-dependent hydrolase (beta-lactamase superfamily II)
VNAYRIAGLIALLAVPIADAQTISIAPGVDLIAGSFVPNEQPDGNSIVFHTAQGLVVVDSGRHAEHTQRVIDYARQANLPIKAVINSHWHLDHIGGNARIRKVYPDVRVYASNAIEAAMHGFLPAYRAQLVDAVAQSKDDKARLAYRDEIQLIDAGHALYPDEIVDRTRSVRIDGHDFELHLESHAVTAGDVWIYDPTTRTLAAGDLVTLPVPFLDTACPARWKISLDDVSRTPFKTLVPGHGAPMQRAQFERYRRAYARLIDCAASDSNKTLCIDGWITDIDTLLPATDRAVAKSLLDYYIDNSLRAAKAVIVKLCTG